jgi:hypothetical protein
MRTLRSGAVATTAVAAMAAASACHTPSAPPVATSCPSGPIATPPAVSDAVAPDPGDGASPGAAGVDLSWVARAQRIVLEHATGGFMDSQTERFDVRRSEARFSGFALAGGRDMYGKYSARMRKVDVAAAPIDAILRELAASERGRPDTRTITVEGSDSFLSWSLLLEDVEVCEARTCQPQRAVRLTATPDGHDFYHWYAWSGLTPVALDRKRPDSAAAKLLTQLSRP